MVGKQRRGSGSTGIRNILPDPGPLKRALIWTRGSGSIIPKKKHVRPRSGSTISKGGSEEPNTDPLFRWIPGSESTISKCGTQDPDSDPDPSQNV